jgi:hypothetical protein
MMIRTDAIYPDVTYKIHSRCIVIRELSHGTSRKNVQRVFERIMGEIVIPIMDKFNLELLSYAIEGNNFYFIITTFIDEDRISNIIQDIRSQFAERYNSAMNRAGPFWIGGSTYEIID